MLRPPDDITRATSPPVRQGSPMSVYVHLPYCQRRCPYCDFNAHAVDSVPEAAYTETLIREVEHAAQRDAWRGRVIDTVFFGGGTPSLFSPASIARLLVAVGDTFAVRAEAEITLEANPGTVTRERLAGYRAAGVNRISFGVQSFDDRHLRTLGRIHDGAAAVTAIEGARTAGFVAINADLMFAIPEQTMDEWSADLATAIALDPGHISAYCLTYEEGTPFHAWRAAGQLRPATDTTEAEMMEAAQRQLASAGYEQYEISNYARSGRACRHNLSYWRRQPYLGIGAGAHSLSAEAPWGRRHANVRAPRLYMDLVERRGDAIASEERPTREEAIAEYLFLGLRTLAGIELDAFAAEFGQSLSEARPRATAFLADGLLETSGPTLRLSATGLMHADSIFAALL